MTREDVWRPPHDPAGLARVDAVLARRPRALLTDVDGTISAIAPTPDAAVPLPGVAALLAEACAIFDLVAAISGRAAADARRLVGVSGLTYIGNHGLERLDATTPETLQITPAALPYLAAVNAALDAVERTVAPRFPGMLVERKGVTGSVHFRLTADPAQARAAAAHALEGAAREHGLRITRGKLVLEVRPPLALHKGTAVAELVRTHGLNGALYLGDDRTDLDAFEALRELSMDDTFQGYSVAVAHAETPADLLRAADLALADIESVPAFLRWLLTRARHAD
ncbi:MAG: trehalose-phosphatase [Ktedonobacterales bacterium]|nr:trehalose-phosphatase [Ktedonobacterales bacterium]